MSVVHWTFGNSSRSRRSGKRSFVTGEGPTKYIKLNTYFLGGPRTFSPQRIWEDK